MTAAEIRAALARSFCQPEWAIFFEVADGTGAASRRRADAVAMNMWPSRGLELRAFEIKVSRSDLACELKDPSKAEAVARYCDSFYLVTPQGLTLGVDIPIGWGVIEVSEKGKVRQARAAPPRDSVEPPAKTFLAALIRAAAKSSEDTVAAMLEQDRQKMRQEDKDRADRVIARHTEERLARRETASMLLESLTDIMGDDTRRLLHDEDFLKAVRAVRALGVSASWNGVSAIQRDLARVGKQAAGLAMALKNQRQTLTSGRDAPDD